jgi:hypothetical protein
LLSAVLGLFGTFSFANGAKAESLIFDGALNNCTGLNCGAIFLNGISQGSEFGDGIPFTAEVFADANKCLRIDVTGEGADMKTVVVSPSGTVGETTIAMAPLTAVRW